MGRFPTCGFSIAAGTSSAISTRRRTIPTTRGAYWENYEIADNMNFFYKTIPSCTPENLALALAGGAPCVGNVGPPPGTTASDPSVRNDNTAFGEDVHRGYHQTAAFISLDFDLIPKVLTITGGTRYYHYDEYEVGSK
jgi:iron complex outermembrane recepter protein